MRHALQQFGVATLWVRTDLTSVQEQWLAIANFEELPMTTVHMATWHNQNPGWRNQRRTSLKLQFARTREQRQGSMTTRVAAPGISLPQLFHIFLPFVESRDCDSENGYTANPSVCIQLLCIFGWINNQAEGYLLHFAKRCVSSSAPHGGLML